MPTRYLVVGPHGDEGWHETAAAAQAAAAALLAIDPPGAESGVRRITADPLVVRHEGFRWRSRQAWSLRSTSAMARIYEMLRIDEALYDH